MFEALVNKYPTGLNFTQIHTKTGIKKSIVLDYLTRLVKKERINMIDLGKLTIYYPKKNGFVKMGGKR